MASMLTSLAYIMELKNIDRGRIKEYAEEYPNAQYFPGQKPWGIKADIATPCATQNEINGEAACASSTMVSLPSARVPTCHRHQRP